MAAQSVAQSAANAQESLTCVKCLVQLAVHQIAGLRGLFPDDAFKRREIAGLPNVMELKARHSLAPRLQPRVAHLAWRKQADFSAEARQVCEWIDRGVNDALAKRCLKTMIFSISSDSAGGVPEVLEQFLFEFAFSSNGATMEVSTKGRGAAAKAALAASVEASTLVGLRKQACGILRSLISAISTLNSVPEERTISVQLLYHDNVDASYEPPGFVAASPDALGVFSREPASMPVGHLKSSHHHVSVHVRSVLDCADDLAQMPFFGQNANLRSVAGGISQPDAHQLTQSDARVLSAKPRAADGAAEGYDSDVTRDDVMPRELDGAGRQPASFLEMSPPPALPATALPAMRRSTRTQKAGANDIVAKLSRLQTAEAAEVGKKRGAVTEAHQESQATRKRKMSAPAQPIRQRKPAAPLAVDLFSGAR